MQQETVRGTVRRVHFANPDSPWMAGVMESAEGESVSFAGKCYADVGDKLEAVGRWGRHPKFGKQFEVESGLVKMDESPEAMAHMIADHDEFRGLGFARAKKVVDAAMILSDDGEAASALIAYPEEIAERSGVDPEIVRRASRIWGERKTYFDSLARLSEQGWTGAQAQKIVSTLGENAPALVRDDPYMLIGRIARFGFKTVDAVARKMGVRSSDPRRLAAGVAYCLDELANEGSTFTFRYALLNSALEELRPDSLEAEDAVRAAIDNLIDEGVIAVNRPPRSDEILSDMRICRTETEVFERLVAGMKDTDIRPLEPTSEETRQMVASLNTGQLAAFAGFSRRRTSVLSGGAGVGKTYMARAVIACARDNGLRVLSCAPTGKAARRLRESTDHPAETIHKMLESFYDQDTGSFRFRRNEHYHLEADLVIVDEVSMVDVRLMRSLLVALPPGCRLLLIGDHHQIPSISAGAILRDLLSARELYPQSVHVLSEIVRQAGRLAVNTSAILDGNVVPDDCPAWGIERTERGTEEGTANHIAELVEFLVTSPEPLEPFGRHLDLAWDVQVLTPQRKGPLGTWSLNVQLQQLRQRLLGNLPPPIPDPGKAPRPVEGDRVIWTKNDYELELFNGTQAMVQQIAKGGAMKILTEDGRKVTVPPAKRVHIDLAYAMTIHKSQGSEWPAVLLVASSVHSYMHDRNLLYTGASRAAESLTIVGDVAGMHRFAKQRKSASRRTLGEFLVQGWRPSEAPSVPMPPGEEVVQPNA